MHCQCATSTSWRHLRLWSAFSYSGSHWNVWWLCTPCLTTIQAWASHLVRGLLEGRPLHEHSELELEEGIQVGVGHSEHIPSVELVLSLIHMNCTSSGWLERKAYRWVSVKYVCIRTYTSENDSSPSGLKLEQGLQVEDLHLHTGGVQ
jgi:hypothetical protein